MAVLHCATHGVGSYLTRTKFTRICVGFTATQIHCWEDLVWVNISRHMSKYGSPKTFLYFLMGFLHTLKIVGLHSVCSSTLGLNSARDSVLDPSHKQLQC